MKVDGLAHKSDKSDNFLGIEINQLKSKKNNRELLVTFILILLSAVEPRYYDTAYVRELYTYNQTIDKINRTYKLNSSMWNIDILSEHDVRMYHLLY